MIADRCVVRDLTMERANQIMTSTLAPSTTRIFDKLSDKSERPNTRAYRLRKSFAAVHFEEAGKGRIVLLPEGAEVRVVGLSSLAGCCEIMFENRLYNMFKADLLGIWTSPTKSRPIQPAKALAVGACA
jgi:hypothetical protein